MDKKYGIVGTIVLIMGILLFFVGGYVIQFAVNEKLVSRDSGNETQLLFFGIAHISGLPLLIMSFPFIIRGFWKNNAALITMLPLFTIPAVFLTILYVLIRSVGFTIF